MKKLTHLVLLAALVFGLGCSRTRPDDSATSPGPNYRELMLKDYDEMFMMVKKHTKSAHKMVQDADNYPDWESNAKSELVQATRLILSRPNTDNMVAKLTPEVRREILGFGNYDDILETVTREG